MSKIHGSFSHYGFKNSTNSTERITAMNCGCLLCANNMTFEFIYLEHEFCQYIGTNGINNCAVELMVVLLVHCQYCMG